MSKKFKIRRKWPEAVYSGSLIMQNHGEELDHGYYVWNVHAKEGKFRKIENDYGFYTLEIRNGVIPILSDVPAKPRLRIRINNTDPAEVKRAVADIRKLYDVQELTINRVDSVGSDGNLDLSTEIGDVSSLSYQNDLIIDYVKRNFVVDDNTVTRIQDINKRLNQSLNSDDLAHNINWKPIRFEWSNMFSYGEDNVIDFQDMNGIVGLFAPNAAGKSSILDAICFCLFDKTSRAYKSTDIVNSKKDSFSCKIEFEIDGTRFFISRSGERNRYDKIPVDIDFWKVVDGEKVSLNGEQRYDTNRIIRQYVGEYEDFILTALSVQNNNTMFIEMSQSERKDLLAQFIGIDVFDKLYTLANDDSREVQTLIKEFDKEDLSTQLANIEQEYEQALLEYDRYKGVKTNLVEKKEVLVNDTMKLTKKLIDVPDEMLGIDELNEKLKLINSDIEDQIDRVRNLKIKKREKEQALLGVEKIIESADEDELRDEYTQYKENLQRFENVTREAKYISKSLEKNKKSYQHLIDHSEFDPGCTFCVDRNKKDAKQLEELKSSIDKESAELSKLKTTGSDLKNTIKDSDVEDRWERYKKLSNRCDKHKNFISQKDVELSRAEIKLKELESKKQDIISDIDLYNEIKDNIRHNKKIQNEINEIKQNLRDVEIKIDDLESNIRDMHGKIKVAESRKKDIADKLDKYKGLTEKFEAYKYYMDAIKRDGIPYELISKSMPGIEEEVNNILSQMVEFGVMLDVDGKNINARIVYDEENIWPLEVASGMEKFISSLAIRAALVNISSLPRPNFLAIDEGFGNLDQENMSSIFMMFDYLKTNFDYVIVISHIDVMRDIVNELIEIVDVNGFSKVQYI